MLGALRVYDVAMRYQKVERKVRGTGYIDRRIILEPSELGFRYKTHGYE